MGPVPQVQAAGPGLHACTATPGPHSPRSPARTARPRPRRSSSADGTTGSLVSSSARVSCGARTCSSRGQAAAAAAAAAVAAVTLDDELSPPSSQLHISAKRVSLEGSTSRGSSRLSVASCYDEEAHAGLGEAQGGGEGGGAEAGALSPRMSDELHASWGSQSRGVSAVMSACGPCGFARGGRGRPAARVFKCAAGVGAPWRMLHETA